MKILQVISYGYLAGGAEKSVLLLRDHLRERGHDVHVLASDHDVTQQHFSDRSFAEIDRPGISLLCKTWRHLWHGASYRAVRQCIADYQPDVVHFHTMGQLSPSALFALGGTPGVLTVHGPEEYTSSILEWGLPRRLFRSERVAPDNLTMLGRAYEAYFRVVQRPVYALAFRRHLAAMVAPSKYMAKVLRNEGFGVPIRQMYNGIELPSHQKITFSQQLLYVGRLEYVKGVAVLLRAMTAIVQQLPNVHLTIVGDGASRPELERFAAQHGLAPYVTFRGWLKGDAVGRAYAKTSAVVIPSIWPENLPTVCIEALAAGRPVIGSRTGGIPELIQDDITGRVVEPGDASALAEAIVDVLSRTDLATMSRACTASMRGFAIEHFIEHVEALYQDVSKA